MSLTADMALRDRLKEVRAQIAEARSGRADARKERDSAKEKFANAQHDGKVTDWPEFKDAQEAVKKLGVIDDKVADLTLTESEILKLLGDEAGPPEPGGNDRGSYGEIRGWNGQRLLQKGSSYATAVETGVFTSSAKFGTIELGKIASREEAMAAMRMRAELPAAPAAPVDSPATAGLIQPDTRGLLAPILRPLRFLDLIPTGTTDSNSIEYVQVTAIPASAGMVAEGALKAQQGITLADAVAPVRTVAGWIKVNRQAMDDAAGLATLINTLLPYDVRRKIEQQCLSGDGTGQNLKGILQQTGIGAPAFVAGDNVADAILRAMTVVILSDQEPNFAALHPLSWQDLLLMRESGSGATRSGQYLYGGPATMAAAQIWGLTITPSVMIAQATPLVGDSNGCTLLFREAVNVKASDSDQDDFVKNRVTVLAEARVAFPVWRPSAFAKAATS
jgi:HK97 family phage major capsid protein